MKKTQEHIFDELLVLQYQAGNKTSLTLLIKRWHKKMISHSYRFTKEMEVSKDIVQECWVVILKKLSSLKEPSFFGIWALSIVSHKSIDYIRMQLKERNFKENFQEVKNEEVDLENDSNQKIKLLKNEINKLPYKQQVVLKLFYIENYTIQEISAILSISKGTVKSRLFNAREQLKKCIIKIK